MGIYPTIFPAPDWLEDNNPIEPEDETRMRRLKHDLCDMALACYHDGADGLSTFNWLPHHQEGMVPDPMRAKVWGQGHLGLQMTIHGLLRDRAAPEAYRTSTVLLPGR